MYSELLIKISIQLFPRKEVQEDEVLLDTTVQEKNITSPNDVKLQKKIIEKYKSPYKEYINQTVPMLQNLVEYYRKT